ncbi:MAG: hypothetical protein ACREJ2_07505 [Planctomycetota bacterium]
MKSMFLAAGLIGLMCLSGCGDDGPTYATPAMETPYDDPPITYTSGDLAEAVPLVHHSLRERRVEGGLLEVGLSFEDVGNYPENLLVEIQFLEQDGSPIPKDEMKVPLFVEPQQQKMVTLTSCTPKAAKYKIQVLPHNGGPMPDQDQGD